MKNDLKELLEGVALTGGITKLDQKLAYGCSGYQIFYLFCKFIQFWNLSKININRRGPRWKKPTAVAHGGRTSNRHNPRR
jgi:hypothetical protein